MNYSRQLVELAVLKIESAFEEQRKSVRRNTWALVIGFALGTCAGLQLDGWKFSAWAGFMALLGWPSWYFMREDILKEFPGGVDGKPLDIGSFIFRQASGLLDGLPREEFEQVIERLQELDWSKDRATILLRERVLGSLDFWRSQIPPTLEEMEARLMR